MSGYVPNLVEFFIAFLLHSLALAGLASIFRYKQKHQKEVAPFLLCLLLNWTVVCALLLPYEAYGVAVWRPNAELSHSGPALFFIALPCHLFLAMIPVSVFFLTLERVLIIRYGHSYGPRAKKAAMYGYALSLLICFLFCLCAFLQALPVEKETKCEIYGCILGGVVEAYLGWRAFCSVFNFAGGITFFVFLYKSSKRLEIQQRAFATAENSKQWKKQQSKNNKMTALAIVNEFFLSFLPHFGPFLWEKIFGPGSSMGTGPLSEIMSSFEVLIFVAVYSQVLKSSGLGSSALSGGIAVSQQNPRAVSTQRQQQRSPFQPTTAMSRMHRPSQSHPPFVVAGSTQKTY